MIGKRCMLWLEAPFHSFRTRSTRSCSPAVALHADVAAALPTLSRAYVYKLLQLTGRSLQLLGWWRQYLKPIRPVLLHKGLQHRGPMITDCLNQGCPVPAALLILALEPWLNYVSNKGLYQRAAYMDDTTSVHADLTC